MNKRDQKRLEKETLKFVKKYPIPAVIIICVLILAVLFIKPLRTYVMSELFGVQTETVTENRILDVPEGSYFEVDYINVDQGDSSLIICDGKTMLIDAGENAYGDTVVNYLKNKGINHLDYVIGTHPDSDHIGGLDTVILNIDCDKIFLSKKTSTTKTFKGVIDAISKTNNSYTTPALNDEFYLGSALVKVIGPVNEAEDNNNNSIAVKIMYGSKAFLFMGDLEKEAEKDISNNNINVKADILKCGHHGSRSSTTEDFLDAVSPEYAVISCGIDNSYGHPHKETLEKLNNRNIKILRTDKQGDIIIKVINNEIITN